ncbi:hypothetical protein R50073_20560 [Maricurvus nonylphenolicus]|uniref:hypothetical protein n=1 Tax=Maricurvus nonylphenolicus TaxID=1008307 RepID=UPI0036F1AA00
MKSPILIATLISSLIAIYAQAEEAESSAEQTAVAEAASEATPESAAEETVEENTEAMAADSEPPLATPEDLNSIRYSCSNQALVRRLEIDYLNAPEQVPCEVNYYKDTEMPDTKETLWQAQNTQGYCEDKAQGFIAKLSNWGWECEKL